VKKKILWPMKLLNMVVWNFLVVILSEPKVKWVIGFGWFARSFRGPMEMIVKVSLF
jgi:hypothetical protein